MRARKRCYNHPHRETSLVCDRCKTTFCDECLTKQDGALLCSSCLRELEDAKAARLTLKQRAILWLQSFGRGLIIAGVLLGVLAGIFFAFRGYLDRPISPEELARFRYAVAGTFETEEGINVSSTVLGGKVVDWTSAAEGYPAKQLINEYTGPGAPPWRSANAAFPQEIVVEFQDPSTVEKVNLANNADEPPETYVKDFEVLVSAEGSNRGFVSVGRFRMEQTSELQRFHFTPTVARQIKLRILSNYGSQDYTSLDEFNTYVIPTGSPRFSRRTPAPQPGR